MPGVLMDIIDLAYLVEAGERERALQAARAKSLPTRASAQFCEDCDAPIPQARQLAVPGVQRCVACQSLQEKASLRK